VPKEEFVMTLSKFFICLALLAVTVPLAAIATAPPAEAMNVPWAI
jgi:hypothetical protein